MIFETGEKVHIIERRQFAEDLRRHIVGEIIMCTEHAIRLKGYVWVFDQMKGFVRKPDKRERVIYLSDRSNINIIPAEVNLDEIKYVNVPKKGLFVTDGKKFSLEISEFGATR
jgi:hypothetical protein